MLINRNEELDKLLEIAESKRAELVLLYGRRRVGKSTLLIEFANRTDALYLLSDISKNILDILSKQIKDEFVKFGTWEDFFEFIYKSKHKIIILDEFQYLYHVNKAWPSMLQRWWEKIKETDKKIILCGSIISTIYKISKGYGSALYGRKTYEMQINPLKFKFIKDFLPDYDIEDLIRAYAIVGGIPRYLEELDSRFTIEENMKNKILNKMSFLYNEPLNLLFEEFRDPAPYVSILLAIIQGYVRFAEIAEVSRIEGHKLPKYLLVLERVRLIEKEIPLTEKKIKSKTTRYRIKDNFYKFWFKFVFRNKSMIERGLEKEVLDIVTEEFNSYVGKCYEGICHELVTELKTFQPTKIGRWWHKDQEIDIVAINENTKEIFFCECKWQELTKKEAEEILQELMEKSKHVDWFSNKRKEYFGIIAKRIENKNRLRKKGFITFDLGDFQTKIENSA